jgi:ABC-type Fe3+/spermidine/putrescine transport system ATPase subunit
MAALELVAVSKRFGARTLFENVSASIDRGQGLAITGPSGVGKTTLLRIIAGFERSGGGEVRIDGRCVSGARTHVQPRDRGLNMMFQDLALWPHMRVRRHLEFVLADSELPQARRRERIDSLLELSGLRLLEQAFPRSLSGGEQQRLAFARALAPAPRLLLLDEPFSNLDDDNRRRLLDELVRRKQDEGMALVVASHTANGFEGVVDQTVALTRSP